MSRHSCPDCHYPPITCVCAYTSQKVLNQTKVYVLQHPSELKVVKNTVRLLSLQLENIEVHTGESEADFTAVKAACAKQNVVLLYPGEGAQTAKELSLTERKIDALILIDGTWKKAHKILQLNPWLSKLPLASFDETQSSQYRIRSSKKENSLSTLEATSLFLNQYESLNIEPLMTLFKGMIEQQMKLMPEHVQERYR